MLSPIFQRKPQKALLKRRLLVRSSIKYYNESRPKRDIRNLTMEDFKPPISMKLELPKLRKSKKTPNVSSKRHAKLLGDLYITGRIAFVEAKLTSVNHQNIGIDTMEIPLDAFRSSLRFSY
ncbi:hypothetical protein SteCoe_8918 [Stentor coeruleus]|uniref:Uncharacterized protein n=1 Tax=Stentor coeruleus TaxID=5963 RepID=A0A1R2CJ27_9CILI|nr:hypothetical protein SteCoe_8918 [Stentor coeruleus]